MSRDNRRLQASPSYNIKDWNLPFFVAGKVAGRAVLSETLPDCAEDSIANPKGADEHRRQLLSLLPAPFFLLPSSAVGLARSPSRLRQHELGCRAPTIRDFFHAP